MGLEKDLAPLRLRCAQDRLPDSDDVAPRRRLGEEHDVGRLRREAVAGREREVTPSGVLFDDRIVAYGSDLSRRTDRPRAGGIDSESRLGLCSEVVGHDAVVIGTHLRVPTVVGVLRMRLHGQRRYAVPARKRGQQTHSCRSLGSQHDYVWELMVSVGIVEPVLQRSRAQDRRPDGLSEDPVSCEPDRPAGGGIGASSRITHTECAQSWRESVGEWNETSPEWSHLIDDRRSRLPESLDERVEVAAHDEHTHVEFAFQLTKVPGC